MMERENFISRHVGVWSDSPDRRLIIKEREASEENRIDPIAANYQYPMLSIAALFSDAKLITDTIGSLRFAA